MLATAGGIEAAPFYATSSGDNTVKFYDGSTVSHFANTGATPVGIDRDAAGFSYIAELGTGVVRRLGPSGADLGTVASVVGATGLRLGPDGALHVSSASDLGGNGTVRRFTPAGTPLANVPGNGGARGITFANGGHLFVADLTARVVREFDGTFTQIASYPTPAFPQGLATGPDGALYVASANSGSGAGGGGVYRLGSFVSGTPFTHFASAAGDTARQNRAIGIGFAPDDGNLYVANLTFNRVDRFNGTTGAFIDSITGFSGPAYLTFVPEPASFAMVAGGVVLAALRRTRRATPKPSVE